MTDQEKQRLLQDIESFLAKRKTPQFIEGGRGVLSVSVDGGETYKELGAVVIGDIRIEAPNEPPLP